MGSSVFTVIVEVSVTYPSFFCPLIVRTHYIVVTTTYKIDLFIKQIVFNLEFSEVTVFYARIPFQRFVGCLISINRSLPTAVQAAATKY